MPDWSLEAAATGPVAGIDEAGRGPVAGPVVAAAVILNPAAIPDGIDDSKRVAPAARARLSAAIWACAEVGLGLAEPEEIDRVNIRQATLNAMARAVASLSRPPAFALVDGDAAPALACPLRLVVGGDARALSIAAASIVAKVARDALMAEAGRRWPGYGFEGHKGYPTAAHDAALRRLGPCPLHRRSFAPVRAAAR